MERRVIIVCCFLGFLGLLSAATAFAAEAKNIKVSQLVSGSCVYPRSQAYGLGLTAAVSLFIAQIIINVVAGSICSHHDDDDDDDSTSFSLTFSWFTFMVAFFMLVWAACVNDERIRVNMYLSDHYCHSVDPGFFSAAAVLSLGSVVLGIFSYLDLISLAKGNQTPRGASVLPIQPRFPLQVDEQGNQGQRQT